MRLPHERHPFFHDPADQHLAERLHAQVLEIAEEHAPTVLARRMGELGFYQLFSADPAQIRRYCVLRELLGYYNPTADSIFAVQGLGTFPLLFAGSPEQKLLAEQAKKGEKISAFALTEPEAGSDVAAMQSRAHRDGAHWVLHGEKTLISNIGINQHAVFFANAAPELGKKGISAFLLPMDAPGIQRLPVPMTVEHPIGGLRLEGVRLPADALIGKVGDGMKIALSTLGTFRVTVGAAAVGMAQRALDDTLRRVRQRRQFGAPLADKQLVQAMLADCGTELEAARLLVYRAAWEKVQGGRGDLQVAMGKLYATEAAFRIIDRCVQLHGGLGVTLGSSVERLAREVRPLRIYEGTSEIQKLLIAADLLKESEAAS